MRSDPCRASHAVLGARGRHRREVTRSEEAAGTSLHRRIFDLFARR